MKQRRFARQFRTIGWNALEGNYWMAVLVTLVAGALGGSIAGEFSLPEMLAETDLSTLTGGALQTFPR